MNSQQADIFHAQRIHLTGVKGVAMASLAQCLYDMGKTLTGSDVAEDFVTKEVLQHVQFQISNFETPLNEKTQSIIHNSQLLVYTAAHGGPNNPEVIWARQQGIPTLSQAEALSQLFNTKKGIAVCGVGGKSTTSAMTAWILEAAGKMPSFSIGVGKVVGWDATGRWHDQSDSEYFVAEADEYVIDPKGTPPIPRFSFLHPHIIVCTNIAHDHPDVYPSFEDTKKAFLDFFLNLKQQGILIINGDDQELRHSAEKLCVERKDIQVITYGVSAENDAQISTYQITDHQSVCELHYADQHSQIRLQIPGIFNHRNAAGAILACVSAGLSLQQSCSSLTTFRSTQRRFEHIGEKHGVSYFDDYAHHPSEIAATYQALKEFYPDQRIVVAFQPHTFSRTRQLFAEFVEVLSSIDELVLLDIFPSAREAFDPTMSTQLLVERLHSVHPTQHLTYLHTPAELAQWCTVSLQSGDICMTMGAGDIYHAHEMIK